MHDLDSAVIINGTVMLYKVWFSKSSIVRGLIGMIDRWMTLDIIWWHETNGTMKWRLISIKVYNGPNDE